MTDIDITAAIRPTSDAIYRQLSGQYGDFSTPSDEEAEAVLKAALPHILAQVEARVKPDREAVARAIHGVIVASAQTGRIDIEVHDSVPSIEFERTIADSVLALLPGKTEQEVREEVAAEIEARANTHIELADRFGGYYQGMRSGLQEAAKLAEAVRDEYLDQIAARIEGATKGPWETRINDLTDEVTVVHDSEAVLQVAWIDADYRHTWAMPDAEFIANARVDVPRLLAAVRAVEAIADELCEDIPEDAANASMKHAGKVIRRALTEALEGER